MLAACIVDRDLRIARANDAAAAIFQRPTIVGVPVASLLPDADAVLRHRFALAARNVPLPDQPFIIDGRRYTAAFHAAPDGRDLLITARDMTRRVRLEHLLRDSRRRHRMLASRDHLTGLLNRRGLDAALHRELRRTRRTGAPLSLLLIDIDWFKAYNDSLGHQQGDVCLRMIAEALTRCMRRGADAACRYGGEEFVLILPDTDTAGAARVAANCQLEIERLAIAHPESPCARITASIGIVATTATQPADAHKLIEQADLALYRAKQKGRNRIEVG